ncbi:trigger factor [Actinocorallia sp. A-T 12471]|uniref:trigger factor n=1 Tax=Actinocorallia sp. A-T 12471 TaxID=3089813 RepID=UPI0029CBDD8A|nr:trigger factor [Actinocorallia sp. A-T 12471]MDX6742940.1 trigger factor [Actinocorallia sp. A-T 12471]
MKTAVEELTPTRVKLTIEVPFEELKPSLDKAYKELAKQVRLKGFRPGKAPARLIDQYVGRGAVLQEAVNDALPGLYGAAIEEKELFVLSQPEVEVTKLDDGKELEFTAEVDIRPNFEVPEYDGLPVTVEEAVVTDEEIAQTLDNLRDRFATLTVAERPAAEKDNVTIDLVAVIDGEDVEDAATKGFSYEVGSEGAVEGLNEAVTGLSAGESATFKSTLVAGSRAGEEADVTVTVQSVKVKELPEADDEFAQLASEFDTIEELREDVRKRLDRQKKLNQISEARDNALEALLEKVDIPVPESVVKTELQRRNEQLDQQLGFSGMTREAYLAEEGKTAEEFEAELEEAAAKAVRGGFILDQLAVNEELGVENEELSEYVVSQAMQMGLPPQQLAQFLTENNQIPALVAEVLRSKALNLVVEHVKITDSAGNELDLEALRREINGETDSDAVEVVEEAAEADVAVEAVEAEAEKTEDSTKE